DPLQFLGEMKQMVIDLVSEVMRENYGTITITEENLKTNTKQEIKTSEKTHRENNITENKNLVCPKCNNGNIIKGKTAYGCSAF
ncbi:MAG: DNA topoisomerase III, partial [Bacteroidales bacterium]|nr:DNA topoisomerase III [Bacteroidales bacterium]